jgi:peptidoglycan/LPS O-acetylase OafA/YrhL
MSTALIYDLTILTVKKEESYYTWVDILRGVAALGVVVFHSRVDLWVGWQQIRSNPEAFTTFDRAVAWLSVPLPFLGSGVMLFFLLSGFCIHFPTARASKIHLRSYAVRRFLRIYPPFLAAVLLSFGIEWVCQFWFEQNRSASLTMLKTIAMVQNYPPFPGQLNTNPSLWSLPVEIELYIAYPALFWLNTKIGGWQTLVLVGIISLVALICTLTIAPWLEGNFLKYWIIWCGGAVLAQLVNEDRLPRWRMSYFIPMGLLFGLACFMVIIGVPPAIGHFVWAGGYFFLLWFCLQLPAPTRLFPESIVSMALWLGKISFSLYLIHFPLFRLWGLIWIDQFGAKPANLFVCLIASFFAVLVSAGFYNLIEKPSHRLGRWVGSKVSTL